MAIKYRHYKGGIYTFLCGAQHTERDEALIIYKNERNDVFARPASMFHGYLEDGTKRFTLIHDDK